MGSRALHMCFPFVMEISVENSLSHSGSSPEMVEKVDHTKKVELWRRQDVGLESDFEMCEAGLTELPTTETEKILTHCLSLH